MKNLTIKCHKSGTTYEKPHFFILNKGMNSGKPQKYPYQNCFVIIFEHENEFDNLYFTAYSLWKTNFWHPFLVGSVVPFLRVTHFKTEFIKRVEVSEIKLDQYNKSAKTLKLLEEKEKEFVKNINIINDFKKAIMYKYCNTIK
jgi:hypothetical protein